MEKQLKPIIEKIHAREILDSRGFPTVEVEISAGGHAGVSAVPSGASTGEFEALELRDGDKARYHGKGVLTAVNNIINEFAPSLIGSDASNQSEIDARLIKIDGSSNKSTFGANASLGISMACAVVSASFYKEPLYNYLNPSSNIMPVPMINVLNGGMHADQGSDLQEIMLFPHGAESFSQSIRMGAEVFHTLKKELKKQGLNTTVGDEGGFAPSLKSNDHAIELLLNSIEKSGFKNAILQENAVSMWPDVVGKNISKISKATSVDKGILFVKVESATWKQELYMQKNEIINKINKKIGSKAIKEIRLV